VFTQPIYVTAKIFIWPQFRQLMFSDVMYDGYLKFEYRLEHELDGMDQPDRFSSCKPAYKERD